MDRVVVVVLSVSVPCVLSQVIMMFCGELECCPDFPHGQQPSVWCGCRLVAAGLIVSRRRKTARRRSHSVNTQLTFTSLLTFMRQVKLTIIRCS